MSLPTPAEEFAKLIEHISKAEEAAAMLAHLYRDNSANMAQGWLAVSELFRRLRIQVTTLATRGKLQ